MITIVIADDQPAIREGLRMRLGLEADRQVICEARDGKEALDIVSRLRPDIIIMDMEMPAMDSLAATKALQSLASDTQVVILTIHAMKQHAARRVRQARRDSSQNTRMILFY